MALAHNDLDKLLTQFNGQWLAGYQEVAVAVIHAVPIYLSIYLSIGINVRFAAMMADVGDGLL